MSASLPLPLWTETVALRATNAVYWAGSFFVDPSLLPSLFMLAGAAVIVAAGSFASVTVPANAHSPDPASPQYDQFDRDCLETDEEPLPVMDTSLAAVVPLLGAVSLGAVYMLLHHVSPETLSRLWNGYVVCTSITSNTVSYHHWMLLAVRTVARLTNTRSTLLVPRYHARLSWSRDPGPDGAASPLHTAGAHLTAVEVAAWALSAATTTVYHTHAGHANFLLSNLVGANLSTFLLRHVRISSLPAAVVLLGGLMLYDVYFVYGTDIMHTVATLIQAPVKLTVPYLGSHHGGFSPATALDDLPVFMLGLGDIVVPGMVVSFCLRFDVWRAYRVPADSAPRRFYHLVPYAKPYFWAALAGYCAGAGASFVALHRFATAQAALFYLAPAVVGAVVAQAAWRRELGLLWEYREGTLEAALQHYCEADDADYEAAGDEEAESDSPSDYDMMSEEEILFFRQSIAPAAPRDVQP